MQVGAESAAGERRVTITLIFLACLMGAVIWWLFRQTIDVQPWVAHAAATDVHASVLARPAAKTALGVFLAVATSLFALFISAYAMRIRYLDWAPLPEPRILTWNTAILVVASIAMHWAVVSARRYLASYPRGFARAEAERITQGPLDDR